MTFVGTLTLDQQGVFDAVNNLGTLPARMLFMVCIIIISTEIT